MACSYLTLGLGLKVNTIAAQHYNLTVTSWLQLRKDHTSFLHSLFPSMNNDPSHLRANSWARPSPWRSLFLPFAWFTASHLSDLGFS